MSGITNKEILEAANKWADNNPNRFGVNGFMAGVRWFEEKFESTNTQSTPCGICDKSEYLENYCFKCGRKIVLE